MHLDIDARQPVQVEARVLPQPKGQFAGGPPTDLGRGKWNPQRYFKSEGQNTKWAVIAVPPDRVNSPIFLYISVAQRMS